MKNIELIPTDLKSRLQYVIENSWKIFKTHFIHHKYEISIEKSFQFHFSIIIEKLGNLFLINNEERFSIELEKIFTFNAKAKNSYIDITCGFHNEEDVNAVIELKFKTEKQGRESGFPVKVYKDLERLEHCIQNDYDFGYLFIITNNKRFTEKGTGDYENVYLPC